MKTVDQLTVDDLRTHAVWQYTTNRAGDETCVRPVKRTPVASLTGKVVGTEVVLANRKKVWALLGNIDAENPRLTAHFLTLSVEHQGRWFHLARYHDPDYKKRGPGHLAAFLELAVNEVFPVSYDLRKFAKGHPLALRGAIPKEPKEKLTRDQIIALAVP